MEEFSNKASRPRFLLAGTASGTGKTSLALGIIGAFRRRGFIVHPFKTGPDYLDTRHLSYASGKKAFNLDPWIQGPGYLSKLFLNNSSENGISVIEGAMGLFDGPPGSPGITAETATIIKSPVVLVVDAGKAGQSVAVMAAGFFNYHSSVSPVGVIFNGVSSERHLALIKEAATTLKLRVFGYMPKIKRELAEQHLGLTEQTDALYLEHLIDAVENNLQIDELIKVASGAAFLSSSRQDDRTPVSESITIGYASDPAFTFYYEDNLETLRVSGAELIPFSPLKDERLPKADGYYFGGGYPENYAETLALNSSMRKSICEASSGGMPIYAECGGALYLSQKLSTFEGKDYPMAGVMPYRAVMKQGLRDFGYKKALVLRDNPLAAENQELKGHEFHWSAWEPDLENSHAAYLLENTSGVKRPEGFAQGSVLASYLHVMFGPNPELASGFIKSCIRAREL